MNKKVLIGLLALVAVVAGVGAWDDGQALDPADAPLPTQADAEVETVDDGDTAIEEIEEGEEGEEGAVDDVMEADAGGAVPEVADSAPVPGATPASPRAAAHNTLRFVRWQQPQGLFSAEVPAGWRIEGRIDPQGLDKGAFLIQGYAPDGRAMFSFAHNWQWFMEYQYGPYRPGSATVETLVVPGIPANLPAMGLAGLRVTYRSPNKTFRLRNPATGMSVQSDQGTIGILAANGRGEILAGTLMGETLYVPMAGSPGLWGLRIFSGGIAPATSQAQADIQTIQRRLVASLELAPEFIRTWSEAHEHTMQRMRDYSREMDRVFERYLASARRSNSRADKDPMEGWAEMMREGHYERDEATGAEHWVGNNNQYWWKNDQDVLVGNNTGQPPADHGNWHLLRR